MQGGPANDRLALVARTFSGCARCECVSDGISISNCRNISLCDYVLYLPTYCSRMHRQTCTSCESLLSIARSLLENGFVVLAQAFRSAFPNVTYHTSIAKRRVLKMPLAAVRVGLPRSGVSEVYLFECVNYHHFQRLLNTFHLEKTTKRLSMTKQQLKSVLSIAQSVREREIIRYTAVVSSGLSATGARKHFGLGAMQQRTEKVEHALQEIQDIRLAFESVASVQESCTVWYHLGPRKR